VATPYKYAFVRSAFKSACLHPLCQNSQILSNPILRLIRAFTFTRAGMDPRLEFLEKIQASLFLANISRQRGGRACPFCPHEPDALFSCLVLRRTLLSALRFCPMGEKALFSRLVHKTIGALVCPSTQIKHALQLADPSTCTNRTHSLVASSVRLDGPDALFSLPVCSRHTDRTHS
jgi:hypothetical protein